MAHTSEMGLRSTLSSSYHQDLAMRQRLLSGMLASGITPLAAYAGPVVTLLVLVLDHVLLEEFLR